MTQTEKQREEFLNQEGYYSERQIALLENITVATLRNRVAAGKDHPPVSPGQKYEIKAYQEWDAKRRQKQVAAS
jgi:hypothetical protein